MATIATSIFGNCFCFKTFTVERFQVATLGEAFGKPLQSPTEKFQDRPSGDPTVIGFPAPDLLLYQILYNCSQTWQACSRDHFGFLRYPEHHLYYSSPYVPATVFDDVASYLVDIFCACKSASFRFDVRAENLLRRFGACFIDRHGVKLGWIW